MNRLDRQRLVKHAQHLTTLWYEKRHQPPQDIWVKAQARQAYRDALESLKVTGFIAGYGVGWVKFIDGSTWYVPEETKPCHE